MGAGEFRKEVFRFVATGLEAFIETAEVLCYVGRIRAQRVDPMAVAEDEAICHSGRVGGVGRDEKSLFAPTAGLAVDAANETFFRRDFFGKAPHILWAPLSFFELKLLI